MRIDVLPDDVLLEVFCFYLDIGLYRLFKDKKETEKWQVLVHVCRRWRNLVFRSPRRLNLRLVCTPQTPAKDRLDIWPTFPLIVHGDVGSVSAVDNVVTALGQSNRICLVLLELFEGCQSEMVLPAMQVSFPELTHLRLHSYGATPPVIPDSFLDGSAPRLQHLQLGGTPFPGLPKLLPSATQLVDLHLYGIPHSGYISPKEMFASLTVLSSLKHLTLEFQSPQSRPDWENQSLPPPKRFVLPALSILYFKGITEYMEELAACIDAPQLNQMTIILFNQIDFDFPRLAQFINITPTPWASNEARLRFNNSIADVILRCPTSKNRPRVLEIRIICEEPDWQLSAIEQVCNSSLPTFSTVEHLHIEHEISYRVSKDEVIENSLWLEVLFPFTAVRNLYVYEKLAPGIAAALQELVGGRMTEVLPSLQEIFLVGLAESRSMQENIRQFAAARQLSDHPIVISEWDGFSDVHWDEFSDIDWM